MRFLLSLLFALVCVGGWSSPSTESCCMLATRLVGEKHARQIVFKEIKATKDVFVLESKKNKIVISGNSANSMAMGLGHYLKYYCLANVSWDKADSLSLPKDLPIVDKRIIREARVDNRFFLNYCTFGYTMVWWQWEEWEHFIDWMAINGINLPLAITGQESVWYKVWRSLGLTDSEIRSYFTGPAHLPWHRMINLDRWQGPLPMSWLEHQENLQKRIVQRERELGMRPVLPAFAGHVPEALKRVFPDAKISRMSSWGGFKDEYRSFFLDPKDSLFSVIQHKFLEEQTRLYGTDHIYGVDPFNEVDPPSWENEFLADAGKTIFSSLTENDPDAVWLQMTWLFYIDRSHWTKQRIESFVKSVPKDKLILLDYFAENTEVWKMTDSYFGQEFVWCYLGNFGGNTMLAGNLRETGKRIEYAIKNAGDNMSGVGSTLEGFDCNPMMYEYVLEKAWTPLQNDDEWISSWADRRLGYVDANYRKAWQLLLDNVYTRTAQLGQAPLTNARPTLKGHGNWTTNPAYHYNNSILKEVSELMKRAASSKTSSKTFDYVNVNRQYLSNLFLVYRDSFNVAYESKNIQELKYYGDRMKHTLLSLDSLLSAHQFFSFDNWVCRAEKFASDNTEKEYYRRNACTLLTTWGESPQSLNDYASRTWAGLITSYYFPRWEMFIDDVISSVVDGKQFDQKAFNAKCYEFERNVANGNIKR